MHSILKATWCNILCFGWPREVVRSSLPISCFSLVALLFTLVACCSEPLFVFFTDADLRAAAFFLGHFDDGSAEVNPALDSFLVSHVAHVRAPLRFCAESQSGMSADTVAAAVVEGSPCSHSLAGVRIQVVAGCTELEVTGYIASLIAGTGTASVHEGLSGSVHLLIKEAEISHHWVGKSESDN